MFRKQSVLKELCYIKFNDDQIQASTEILMVN